MHTRAAAQVARATSALEAKLSRGPAYPIEIPSGQTPGCLSLAYALNVRKETKKFVRNPLLWVLGGEGHTRHPFVRFESNWEIDSILGCDKGDTRPSVRNLFFRPSRTIYWIREKR